MGFRSNITKVALAFALIAVFVAFGTASFSRAARSWMLGGFSSVFRIVSFSVRTNQAAHESERTRLLVEVASREEFKRENELLREALRLKQEGAPKTIPASVIGVLHEGRDELLLLNRGSRDAVHIDDVVVSRDGVLVGIVVSTSESRSHVVLVTSPSRSTDVSHAGTELHAIAKGNNHRELIIDLVPQQSDLKAGDLLVASTHTTGLDAPLLVAEVREVKQAENEVFKFVRAVHLFDPADAEVIVLAP